MALTFPFSAAAFADLLRVADVTLNLDAFQEASGVGNGETIYADRAPNRYLAEVTTVPMLHSEAHGIVVLLRSLVARSALVHLYPWAAKFPAYDPDGTIMDTTEPEVNVVTDAFNLSFSGFPADYQVARGEFLSIAYGTGRYYLGQFAESRTASGAGAIATVAVVPALPAAVANGDVVNVIAPTGLFQILPNTVRPASSTTLHQSVAFTAQQTYRAG